MDDPQFIANLALMQRLHKTGSHLQDAVLILASESENDDSGMAGGWIDLDIREAAIERNENSFFCFAHRRDARIVSATKSLLYDA